MNLEASQHIWFTIFLCGAITFGLRFGGLRVANRLEKYPRFQKLLDALPGCVLVSLIAPELLTGGTESFAAGLLVVLVAFATRSVFLSMALGVIAMAALRAI